MSIVKRIILGLFVALYVFSGVRHFTDPNFYVGMMPSYLPFHLELVYLSGVIEIVLGLLAAVPRLRHFAAWAVVAMLLAFMPGHPHMATNPQLYPEVPPLALWMRIPLQAVLIVWAYWFTRSDRAAARLATRSCSPCGRLCLRLSVSPPDGHGVRRTVHEISPLGRRGPTGKSRQLQPAWHEAWSLKLGMFGKRMLSAGEGARGSHPIKQP